MKAILLTIPVLYVLFCIPVAASPPVQSEFVGYLDVANCHQIQGWAADKSRPGESIYVTIYIDGEEWLRVLADVIRQDVGEVLGDNGKHGFMLLTPSKFKDGRRHEVRVRFDVSEVIELDHSGFTFSCSSQGD